MKKALFLFVLSLFFCGSVFSQEEKSKKDTTNLREQSSEVTTFDSENLDDEETSTSGFVPGLLHSSNDVYSSNTSYTFGIAYFKSRGIDSKYQTIAMNGMEMENAITGRASYSQWGGLNNMFRYPENVLNLNPASFAFGDIGGATNYNVRASSYRKQIRANYSLSNRSYNNRIMLTYASGVIGKGWSFAASASARFGSALSYVEGTSYNGYSYFLAAEKKFNEKHSLNLAVFGAPTVRSLQSNSTQEVYDLMDNHYYNSNWGWYNGEKRNARVRNIHEPVILLTHYYTPESNKFQITSTLCSTFGRSSTTSLNWGDVPDPRPDYYRNQPSYFADDPNTELAAYYTNAWLTDESFSQINWDKMYEINQTAAAIGNRAQYIVENRVIDHVQVAGASNIVANLTNHIKLSAGIDIRGFQQRNYKTINDLLGGSYWLNEDKFAEGESPDNPDLLYDDLDNKGKELGVGDKFGYDYAYNVYKQKLWAMTNFAYNHVDFHIGLSGTVSEIWRTGYMRNGRFPDNSQGNSEIKTFPDFGIKAGITYKVNGRNYLVLNSMYQTVAPSVLESFISPSIRNDYTEDLVSEKNFAADFSYIMRYSIVKLRLSGYYAKFTDVTDLFSFYHDDYGSYVNYSMTGIDKENIGMELGLEVKLGSMFAVVLAGNIGDYRYTNRPSVTITADNGYDVLGNGSAEYKETVYWKNFHVAGTPQIAGTLGLKFNHNYWYVNINA
ncbi:MAG: TonB-dependent receptor, partial [Bacteroidales bacterium]|nr:TonB-dependent receptor [Bacteroidales bacterium]